MSNLAYKAAEKNYLTLPYQYTEADVLRASGIKPLHQRKRIPLIQRLQTALTAIEQGQPTVEHWRELADATNIAETMLTLRYFDDPDGLFTDVVNAVADLGRQHGEGQTMRVNAEQLEHLSEFAEAYEQLLSQASEQAYILAHRATERRLRELLLTGPDDKNHEFIIN